MRKEGGERFLKKKCIIVFFLKYIFEKYQFIKKYLKLIN